MLKMYSYFSNLMEFVFTTFTGRIVLFAGCAAAIWAANAIN